MCLRLLIAVALLLAPELIVRAAPSVTISESGFHTGNRLLDVWVMPDVDTFVPDTSLAVELDFEFSLDVVGAMLNDSFWSVQGDNPGNNPFTGNIAEGLVVDTANDTIFVAVGSELYATATPMNLMTVEIRGLGGHVINMGGNTVLPGTPEEYLSSRIAQNGVNYDGILIANYQVPFLPCDFDGSGSIGNGDLTLLLDNWGEQIPPIPAGWIGSPPTAPSIGNDELTSLLDCWGIEFDLDLDAARIPEPCAAVLVAAAISGLLTARCRTTEIL